MAISFLFDFLAQKLPDFELITNKTPLGSALGAAMAISDEAIGPKFMLKNFSFHPQKTFPDEYWPFYNLLHRSVLSSSGHSNGSAVGKAGV